MKNPKEKGNSFERKIAKLLSMWSGFQFIRTPMSGAIHNFKDKRVVSDIVPSESVGKFPFSIECKNVECSWEFSSIIDGTSQTFTEHWQQCCSDAEREGLLPWLIFTKNYRKIYSAMRIADFNELAVKLSSKLEIHSETLGELVVFDFGEFISKITCEKLLRQGNTRLM